MSIDALRALKPRYTRPSNLTDEQWAEVFAAIERGVPTADIFEEFGCHYYLSISSFRRSIDNRKNKHGPGK